MVKSRSKLFGAVLLLFVAMITLLSGCTEKAKSEKEVIADLQTSEWFISEDFEIDSYEIIKRQTDFDKKSDVVYLTVSVDEPEINCELSYIMQYTLYNEGWLLENVQKYADGIWRIDGLTEDQLISDTVTNDSYFQEWEMFAVEAKTNDETYTFDDGIYKKEINVTLTASALYFDYRATYQTVYEITESGWKYEGTSILQSDYMPTYSPDLSATDAIFDSLVLAGGATEYYCDSFEYLKTEENWENREEIRYYIAKKNWFYGTESYLVAIPLTFSLENGEGKSQWTYSKSAIVVSLYAVDWDIEGSWVNKYDPASSPYISSNMDISTITSTDDPEVFTVNLSCDASSSKYRYLCKTNGYVDAELKYVDPGRWFLYIDDSIATLNDDRAWYSFELIGYSSGATHEGFFWNYMSDYGSPLTKT